MQWIPVVCSIRPLVPPTGVKIGNIGRWLAESSCSAARRYVGRFIMAPINL